MRRLCRSTWLLWLFIALLPLRGLAMGAFAATMGNDPTPVVVAVDQAAPCPMHVGMPASDVAPPANLCVLCDVCHLVAMPVSTDGVTTAIKPQAQPQPALGLGAGRAPADGLFRPPR